MRPIFSTILIIFLICSACNSLFQNNYFEKDFYEKISGIKFPKDYETITTADNGEFVTITILDLKRSDCKKFYHNNNFQPLTDTFSYHLMGLSLLDSIYRQLSDKSRLLKNSGQKGKNNWTYLIDTTTCRLYCEIGYPDWSGD